MLLMIRWLGCAVLLLGSALAAFVPPAEGGAPFRRDKLPVDVATMTGLSQQMVTLAAHANGLDPEDARIRAQLVGLALALDPANRRARDLSETMQEGGMGRAPEGKQLRSARSQAWNLLGWLEQPEAGEDGQALAACLSDVLARTDRSHPDAGERAKRERGQWDGWVAKVDAFRDREVEAPKDPPSGGGEEEKPDPGRLVLKEASVKVPLWVTSEQQRQARLRIVPLKINAWISEGGYTSEGKFSNPKDLRIATPEPIKTHERKAIAQMLSTALEERHGSLPQHLIFGFSLPEGVFYDSRNYDAPTGAMFVLANAVFTGVEPSGIVIATLQGAGGLGVPTGFWHMVRTLADGEYETMVMAGEAMDYLPSLLTLDKAEFFFRNEVLLAKDANALVELASSKTPERVMQARESFEAIRGARGTRSLGSFVGYDSTRQRLGQVVEQVPEQVSARMLALRGTSQWPRSLPRKIYAREVRSCLEPMRAVFSTSWESLKTRDLLDAEQACRESLRTIEKVHASVEDRDQLYTPALSTVKLISGVVTDIRRADEYFQVRRAVTPVIRSYVSTVKLLTAAAGDENGYDIPFEKHFD